MEGVRWRERKWRDWRSSRGSWVEADAEAEEVGVERVKV